MGTVLVAAITLALLNAFDGSTRASAANKQRGIASDLAQQDQEQLRALDVAHLSNLRATKTITAGGAKYTVSERADWVSDDTGALSCTNGSSSANYLEVTSTVTWPGMTIRPVVQQSLVAPPVGAFQAGQGSVAIQVLDRPTASGQPGNQPVAGVPVQLGGAGGYTDITDANGCVVFGYIPSANYTVSISRPGWVDFGGNNPSLSYCSAPSGSTHVCTAYYDQAGDIKVGFQTKSYGASTWSDGAWAPAVSIANTAMSVTAPDPPLSGSRSVTSSNNTTSATNGINALPSASNSTIDIPDAFPFTQGYSVYAGSCAQNDPSQALYLLPNYYALNTGQITVAPGGTNTQLNQINQRVIEPSLNVRVLDSLGVTGQNGATVKITDQSCGVAFPSITTQTVGGTTGRIPNTGFPFAKYLVCAQVGTKVTTATVLNNNLNGTTVNLLLPLLGTSGAHC